MAVGAYLRDRARVLRKTTTPERREGGYIKEDVIGPWFRCYFDPGTESEQRGNASIRRRRSGARLIAARKDLEGVALELKPEDRIEIVSRGHGILIMDVMGKPEKLVKGRTVLAWDVSLGKTNRESPG